MEKSRSQKTGSKVNPALSEINGFGHTAPLSLPCVRQATRAVLPVCGVADGKAVDTGVGSAQIKCKEPTCGIPSSSQWVQLPYASAASEHPKCTLRNRNGPSVANEHACLQDADVKYYAPLTVIRMDSTNESICIW